MTFGESWGSAVWGYNAEPILFLSLDEKTNAAFPPYIETLLSIYLPFFPIIQQGGKLCRRGGFRTPTTFHQVCTPGSSISRVYKSKFKISDLVHTTGVEDIQEEVGLLRGIWAWLHPVLPSHCSLPLEEDRRLGEQGSCWEAGGAHLHTLPALANSSSCTPPR